jgi:hypothetical protein
VDQRIRRPTERETAYSPALADLRRDLGNLAGHADELIANVEYLGHHLIGYLPTPTQA